MWVFILYLLVLISFVLCVRSVGSCGVLIIWVNCTAQQQIEYYIHQREQSSDLVTVDYCELNPSSVYLCLSLALFLSFCWQPDVLLSTALPGCRSNSSINRTEGDGFHPSLSSRPDLISANRLFTSQTVSVFRQWLCVRVHICDSVLSWSQQHTRSPARTMTGKAELP